MLSILIPVKNHFITSLVKELDHQSFSLNIRYEIVLSDDGSEDQYLNQYSELNTLDSVKILLNSNRGRSTNRNRLASSAQFPYLLFLDADIVIPENLIKNYVTSLKSEADIIVGGVKLEDIFENNGKYYFRRYFGQRREAMRLSIRLSAPYNHFNSCNFLIKKTTFERIRFNENLKTYGYEDTFFCLCARIAGISITHIENPVFHYPQDSFEGYIEKTNAAIENLSKLIRSEPDLDFRNFKLVKVYFFLKKFKLLLLVNYILKAQRNTLLWFLSKKRPNLFFFDLFKLSLLVEFMEGKKLAGTEKLSSYTQQEQEATVIL